MQKDFSGRQDVGDGPRFLFGNIDADFLHRWQAPGILRWTLEVVAIDAPSVSATSRAVYPRLGVVGRISFATEVMMRAIAVMHGSI